MVGVGVGAGVAVALVAGGLYGAARFAEGYAGPIAAQLWVEERGVGDPRASQAIAEVLIRRADRARASIADLQRGRVLDRYTGPVSAWGGFIEALDRGTAAMRKDPVMRARADRAAARAWVAVRLGLGAQEAPGALWYRHVDGDPPLTWRATRLVRVLPGPQGSSKVLALYAPL
jgi:hypothetical protein